MERKPARNLVEFANSQPAWIKRLVPFGSRFPQKALQLWARLVCVDPALLGLIVLTREEKPRKVHQLQLLVFRQTFANLQDFLRNAHTG
jgi:hypothetical protein